MKTLNRKIEYLRISLTENCNLRCSYCMEKEAKPSCENELDLEKIKKIVQAFALMGGKKIRFTGGEPLLRKDIENIVYEVSKISGIKEIALTTNGILLEDKIFSLISKGLTSLNISLDSLKEDRYREITGGGDLKKVLKAIEIASKTSLKVKINVVPLKGKNEDEIFQLANLTRLFSVDVRFIELMPIGLGKIFKPILKDEILEKISENFKMEISEKKSLEGPAKYFKLPQSKGRVGYISALSEEFCDSCNRIRITSKGFLKLCLHWNKGLDLTPYLNSEISPEDLKDIFLKTLEEKPKHHIMREISQEKISELEKKSMFQIGG